MSQQRGKGSKPPTRRAKKPKTSRASQQTPAPDRGRRSRTPARPSRVGGPRQSSVADVKGSARGSKSPSKPKRPGSTTSASGSRAGGTTGPYQGVGAVQRRQRAGGAGGGGSTTNIILAAVGVVALGLALFVALSTTTPPEIDTESLISLEGTGKTTHQLEAIKAVEVTRGEGALMAKRRAELEQALVAADKFHTERMKAKKEPQRFAEVLAKWTDMVEKAAGTDFASYVQTRIDEVERLRDEAAATRVDDIRENTRRLARAGLWDEVFARIEAFPEPLRGAPAYERLRDLQRGYTAERKRWNEVSVRISAQFGKKARRFQGVRLIAQNQVHRAGNHLKLVLNEESALAFAFDLKTIPKPLYLRVVHLSSIHRGRHVSPVTLTVNGRILVGNWSPSEGGWITTRWDIADYVKVGQNQLTWQLGDARTHYWLRKFEISDWQP